jgi:hypothetical protein
MLAALSKLIVSLYRFLHQQNTQKLLDSLLAM